MQLYKISDQLNQVLEMMEHGAEDLEDTLELLNLTFEDKVENCIMAYRNLIADRDKCKAEASRINERVKTLDKQAELLKRYVEVEMKKIGKEEVKSALFKIKLTMNPPSVNIIDNNLIPSDYFIQSQPTLSRSKILEDLKRGVEIAGAELKQEKSLRIS